VFALFAHVSGSGTQSQMVLQRTLERNHNHNPSQIHNRIRYTQMLAVVAIIIIVAIAANKIAEFIIPPLLLLLNRH
jgi:hypothetical protein